MTWILCFREKTFGPIVRLQHQQSKISTIIVNEQCINVSDRLYIVVVMFYQDKILSLSNAKVRTSCGNVPSNHRTEGMFQHENYHPTTGGMFQC